MFFDSTMDDERNYSADEFAEYFRRFIRNGVFNGDGDDLKVGAQGQDMKTHILPGYAWVEGYLYKIDMEPLKLYHQSAHAKYNRIDRVVIRLDKTLENRYVKAFILTGTPAETPQVPELTRDENIYELALAQVEILAGKSFIEAHQITDERLNNEVCGFVTHLFEQVDTTELFNEWKIYLDAKRAQGNEQLTIWLKYMASKKQNIDIEYTAFLASLQSKFLAFQTTWSNWTKEKLATPDGEFYIQWKSWFDEVRKVWDSWFKKEALKVWRTWVEDKLATPNGEFYVEWKEWFEEIQDVSNLVPRSHFKAHRDRTVREETHGLRISGNNLEVEISDGKWRRLEGLAVINTWGGM